MAESTQKPDVRKTKIEQIEEIYGKDTAPATLEETSKYLKSKGFGPLADLLVPAK